MQCRPIVIHSDSFICLPERHLRVDNGVQCILAVLLPEWVGYSWGFFYWKEQTIVYGTYITILSMPGMYYTRKHYCIIEDFSKNN